MIKEITLPQVIATIIVTITLIVVGISFYNFQENTLGYCKSMSLKGYNSYHDVFSHEDCRISNKSLNGFADYNSIYNKTCSDEKYDEKYAKSCIWGSSGYITLLVHVGLMYVLLMFLVLIWAGKPM